MNKFDVFYCFVCLIFFFVKQIQLQRNKQKIKEDAKQLEIYQDHIKTVKEATKLNQELVKAKKEEIAAEKNLLKVQDVLQERLLKDKRDGEKRLQELDDEAERFNMEIEELEETIRLDIRVILLVDHLNC